MNPIKLTRMVRKDQEYAEKCLSEGYATPKPSGSILDALDSLNRDFEAFWVLEAEGDLGVNRPELIDVILSMDESVSAIRQHLGLPPTCFRKSKV